MQFVTTGNRIAVENFALGDLYTITFTSGIYINSACIGIGENFVSFQRNEPELLFTLNMETAELVSSIDLYAGGTGTNNYNDLTNKPQINEVELVGNKSLSDLGIQATISDIDTIRSGAAAGATAVQPDALSDYQPVISDLGTIRAGAAAGATAVQPADMTAALATKQDALNAAQLNAVNSGITSTDVAQIETNKNNILYNTNNGVKNTFDFANAPQEANIYTTVVKTSTSLTVTANNPSEGSSSVVYSGKDYPAGDYIFSCKITDYSCTTETAKIYISTSTAAGTGVANKTITGNGTIQIPFHWNGGKVYIKYFPNESNTVNQSNTFTASENMIMLASISDTTYQPYALSNAELAANILPSSYNAVEVESGAPISILSGGYARIGNLVCVNLKISVTGAISQADPLVKGLPKPILEYNTGYGAVSLTNNIGRVFNVIGVGSIAYGDSTSISSGTVILSGMYIAQ